MPQPTDPRFDLPLIHEAIRGWYRSLAEHDLEDVAGHLQGLGVLVVLLAKMAPATKRPEDVDYRRKLNAWRKAIAEMLVIEIGIGGAS